MCVYVYVRAEVTHVQKNWSDHMLWWPARNRWLPRSRFTLEQCGMLQHVHAELARRREGEKLRCEKEKKEKEKDRKIKSKSAERELLGLAMQMGESAAAGVTSDVHVIRLHLTPVHKPVRVQLPDLRLLDHSLDFARPVFQVVVELCKLLGAPRPVPSRPVPSPDPSPLSTVSRRVPVPKMLRSSLLYCSALFLLSPNLHLHLPSLSHVLSTLS